MPEWLKESSVVGYVKRQLEKASKGEESPKAVRSVPVDRPVSDHERALRTFADAFTTWEAEAFAVVLKAINADPVFRVNWCVLLGVPALWDHPHMEFPNMHMPSGDDPTGEPFLPPLSEELERAIQLAFKGTRNGWIDTLKEYEQVDPDERGGLGIPHPRVLELLAQAIKLTLPEVPRWVPVATQNAPATEPASVAAEAVTA